MNLFELIGFIGSVASAVYLFITRDYGTPLKDSLSEEQLKIKQQSAGRRRRAYYSGIGVACVLWLIYKRK